MVELAPEVRDQVATLAAAAFGVDRRGAARKRTQLPYDVDQVDRVRAAVRDAIESDGLRKTARALRLAPMNLKRFAASKTLPYRPTWKRLVAWYESRPAVRRRPTRAEFAAAVSVLTADFRSDPERRSRLAFELESCVSRAYAEVCGCDVPTA